MRRVWPYLRVYGGLALVFAACATPFIVAWLVFGAPWWIAYFILVPQTFAVEYYREFCQRRGWIV